MNTRLRLALGFLGALVPVLALAAPQSVSNITAVNESGNVRVSWALVDEPDIVAYRIFYSHTSILQNSGLYDDLESVDGTTSTHLLRSIPPAEELFISVLAVNSVGEESPYFLEEAHVMVQTNTGSSSAGATTEMRLLGAEAVSATGVVLRFSHMVVIPQDSALDAITIQNASGTALPMRRYIIEGNTVTVHTATQVRNTVYSVRIGQVVTGKDASGGIVPLSADQTPTLFMGHVTGLAVMPEQPGTVSSQPDVTQLRLGAQPDGGSTYHVEATWQAPAGVNITGYSVAQTTDGGSTYSTPIIVPATATAVKISGVTPGNYGVRVTTLYANNTQSRGVTQLISLPTIQGGMQGSVTEPTTGNGSTNLPNSGPALWLAVAGLGALAGTWQLRARRTRAA